MQTISLQSKETKNAIKIIDINQITDQTKHYYILGLNQGIILIYIKMMILLLIMKKQN